MGIPLKTAWHQHLEWTPVVAWGAAVAAVEGSVNSRTVAVGQTLPLAWRKNTPAVPEWF